MQEGPRLVFVVSLMLVVISLVLVGCQETRVPPALVAVRPTESPNREFAIRRSRDLQEGQRIYDLRCAHCHGDNGDGQVAATVPTAEALGLHIVPPQDSTGHTWLHPSQRLRQVIREGLVNPLHQFPMPPFADVMTEEEIDWVIAYMALWWTEEQQEWQKQVTEYHAELEAQYPTLIPDETAGTQP